MIRAGQVVVVTRSQGGSAAARLAFFKQYSAANPFLPMLDDAYRNFATDARKATCLDCHAPDNQAEMDHLVLLQTPMHASGEIDRVIKEVPNGEMPRDDVGLRKEIDPKLRADILRTAEEFRRALTEADHWEAKRRVTEYGSHVAPQP